MKYLLIFILVLICTLSFGQSNSQLPNIDRIIDRDELFDIAMKYSYGDGVTKNKQFSTNCILKAANLGHPKSEFIIGLNYYTGDLLEVNYDKSLFWLKKSANDGFDRANMYLGDYFSEGKAVKPDKAKSEYYYDRASSSEDEDLLCEMANKYYHGLGPVRNFNKAFELYLKAERLGNVEVYEGLGQAYKTGNGTPKNIKKAIECYTRSAERGSVSAMEELYLIYRYEQSSIDNTKAFFWLQKGAYTEKEDGFLLHRLGGEYKYGEIIEQDLEKSYECYKKSAELDFEVSYIELGICYLYGLGTTKDETKAMNLFITNIDVDNRATYELGNIFLYGLGVKKNVKNAIKYYEMSANYSTNNEPLPNYDAINQLGLIYYCDDYGMQDYSQAVKWFEISAEAGNAEGLEKLGNCFYYGNGINPHCS